jgi:hypothetical protein
MSADYNSINFRNSSIDRMSGKFGNGDPVNSVRQAIVKTDKPELITKNRASAARDMRKNVTPLKNEDGSVSTHVMSSGEGGTGKYKYTVNPTVFPNEGGKTWTDLRNDPKGAYDEASKRGEVIGFKSEKKAEKFGMGSWKKGQSGREAKQMYRDAKKNNELYTQSVGAQKIGKDDKIKKVISKK